jgi:uncharacterized protein YfaS (alpha-2-macroglobulin family)
LQLLSKNSKTGVPVVNSRVVVLDENKVVLDKQLSNDRGEVLFNVECQKDTVEGVIWFQIKLYWQNIW